MPGTGAGPESAHRSTGRRKARRLLDDVWEREEPPGRGICVYGSGLGDTLSGPHPHEPAGPAGQVGGGTEGGTQRIHALPILWAAMACRKHVALERASIDGGGRKPPGRISESATAAPLAGRHPPCRCTATAP